MKKIMNRKILCSVFSVAFAGIGVIYYLLQTQPHNNSFDNVSTSPPPQETEEFLKTEVKPTPSLIASELTDKDDRLVAERLKELFYENIKNTTIQIQLLDKLRAYLIEKYGSEWRAHLNDIIDSEFSSHSQELLATLQKMETYQEQSKDYLENAKLMAASGTDIQELEEGVWQARYDIFGEDAEKIWQSGHSRRQLKTAFKSLENQTLTIPEKLTIIKSDIERIYVNNEQNYLSDNVTELSEKFLDLPSVKESLLDMSGNERRLALRTIRRSFGMDNDALDRWDTLDEERAKRQQGLN